VADTPLEKLNDDAAIRELEKRLQVITSFKAQGLKTLDEAEEQIRMTIKLLKEGSI